MFVLLFSTAGIAEQAAGISADGHIKLDDGREVELAGVVIPDASQAAEAIKIFIADPQLQLTLGKQEQNRYQRILAQVRHADGSWLQKNLLEQGLAFVYPTPDNKLFAADMYKAESAARAAKLGIWQSQDYKVFAAGEVASLLTREDKFAIVQGRVTGVKVTKKRTFINFGDDWKTDFTAMINKENARAFSGIDLKTLVGKEVRVRGWLDDYNGPLIEVFDSAQWEVL